MSGIEFQDDKKKLLTTNRQKNDVGDNFYRTRSLYYRVAFILYVVVGYNFNVMQYGYSDYSFLWPI